MKIFSFMPSILWMALYFVVQSSVATSNVETIIKKTCDETYECFQNEMRCSASTNECNLICSGAYSCSEALLNCPSNPANESAKCNIYCTGYYSCQSLVIKSNRMAHVECDNATACDDIRLNCGQRQSVDNLTTIYCGSIIQNPNEEDNNPKTSLSLSHVSAKSLNTAFGVIYALLVVLISVVMFRLRTLGFYIRYERFMSVPSILWAQSVYQCIVCFVMSSNGTYLSNPHTSSGILISALLVPSMLDFMLLLLCILYAHDKFWHIPTLQTITCSQPILFPYRIGLIYCVAWVYFFFIILPVSLIHNNGSLQHGHREAHFVAAHIIIVTLFGCFISFALLSALVSHLQISRHDAPLMKWLLLSSFFTVMLFLMQLLCAIETQQDKADEIRALELTLEVVMILAWIKVFPSMCLLEIPTAKEKQDNKQVEMVQGSSQTNMMEGKSSHSETISFTVDDMFASHNEITICDVICCCRGQGWQGHHNLRVMSQSFHRNGASDDSVMTADGKFLYTFDFKSSVMENVDILQIGTNVEVMPDANVVDSWMRGVVSNRKDQIIDVVVEGVALSLSSNESSSKQEQNVGKEKITTSSSPKSPTATTSNQQLQLDLAKDSFRIRLQLFGVDPVDLKRKPCRGYEVELPCILTDLKSKLFEVGGHTKEKIFNTIPHFRQVEEFRHIICQGKLHSYDYTSPQFDPHLLSYFINIWFREMPNRIFNTVSDLSVIDFIIHDKLNADAIPQICAELPPLSRALLYWLFDLCADIAKHEEINKMNVRALAIVVAPNIFKKEKNDIDLNVLHSKLADFCVVGVEWRTNNRGNSDDDGDDQKEKKQDSDIKNKNKRNANRPTSRKGSNTNNKSAKASTDTQGNKNAANKNNPSKAGSKASTSKSPVRKSPNRNTVPNAGRAASPAKTTKKNTTQTKTAGRATTT